MTISTLPNSAGWNEIGPIVHPQPRAVDRPADAGHDRQQQQDDPARPIVYVYASSIASSRMSDERQHERDQPDTEPRRPARGQVRLSGGRSSRTRARPGAPRSAATRVRAACDTANDEPRPDEARRDQRSVQLDARRNAAALAEPDQRVRADARGEREQQQPQAVGGPWRTFRVAERLMCRRRVARSVRICSTMLIASLRSFAVIPSASAGYCGNAATSATGMSVSTRRGRSASRRSSPGSPGIRRRSRWIHRRTTGGRGRRARRRRPPARRRRRCRF